MRASIRSLWSSRGCIPGSSLAHRLALQTSSEELLILGAEDICGTIYGSGLARDSVVTTCRMTAVLAPLTFDHTFWGGRPRVD